MWIKRALCGLDFEKQTIAIGVLYLILAGIALVYGFVIIAKPEFFMDELPVWTEHHDGYNGTDLHLMHEENGTESEHEDHMSEEEKLYIEVFYHAKSEGIAMVIDALIGAVLTVMLMAGARQNKSILFVPWLTGEITVGLREILVTIPEMTGGYLVYFLIMTILSVGCTYLVLSHFVMLRRIEKESIRNTVLQAGSQQIGTNYGRLHSETGPSSQEA